MIYVTGDIHGDARRFSINAFPEQKEMNKNDTVIQLGDFGLIWNQKETENEKYWLKYLENKSFTLCFCDGNHENFDRLYNYPVKEWNGGLVHEIRPHILHLMRGEVYTIEDKKFFCFGGASSHDIQDGIIEYDEDGDWKEKAKKLDKQGKYMYRIKGLSWWPEELPSQEEMDNGIRNLEKHNWKVDYIITHSPHASGLCLIGKGFYEQDILTEYLEEIRCKADYNSWYAGHMHTNRAINAKDILLYEQIVRII